MTPRLRRTLLISGGAVALFFAMRALPDTACGFMHIHDVILTEVGLEYCDPAEVSLFADPTEIRFPVAAEVKPDTPLAVGVKSRLRLTLRGPNGNKLLPNEIAISHTKQVHLTAVDPTLDHCRHIHPTPGDSEGEWLFDLEPVSGGEQVFFIDCVHARTRRQQIMRVVLPCAGATAEPSPLFGLTHTTRDGLRLALTLSPEYPKAGDNIDITLKFHGKDGAPVKLAPVMAAYAHLAAFDTARTGFAHLHPIQTGREPAAEPELRFRFTTAKPGRYRLRAQFDIGAGEAFAPFDLIVK